MADKKKPKPRNQECPESVSGHRAGTDGSCMWCSKKNVARAMPRPRTTEQTELGREYRRHYDPDYGTRKDDT